MRLMIFKLENKLLRDDLMNKILNLLWKYKILIFLGALVILSMFGITLPVGADGTGPVPHPISGGG